MAWVTVVGLIVGVGAVLFRTVWRRCRAERVIDRWAAENGFRVIDKEYRPGRLGGVFRWRYTRRQQAYYVTLEDREGRIRKAEVLCGSSWFGMFSGEVKVHFYD